MATLSKIYDSQNSLIDEAIVIYFKAPFSFTGEDVVEFQCHGGFVVASMVVDTLLSLGARVANAGEFSKRAFLNGKMDLSEAEAISKLIEARREAAVKILARQMKGELSGFVNSARENLLELLAHVEVLIDYADEDLPQNLLEMANERVRKLQSELENILDISNQRKGLMSGFKVAIVGKPNVGKSSLLNALLKYDRAIISPIAGTTRDTIEEELRVGSHLVKIVDTAGIRQTDEFVESIGIERSVKAIDECDIVLALFDGSRAKDSEDEKILELLKDSDKKVFYLLNKVDMPIIFENSNEFKHISTCSGASEVIDMLRAFLDTQKGEGELMLTSNFQMEAINSTCTALKNSEDLLEDGSLELFAFWINEAISSLGLITRPYGVDEMLDKMFSSFCLGK